MTTEQTGRLGEEAVAAYLRKEGFELCARNWRSGRYELDIVARKADVLHIVEVKTRRAGSLTPPEAAATELKFRSLRRAADCYLYRTGWQGDVQFDLAAVEVSPDGGCEIRLIENAMECHW